jgi:ATP-dependent Clp protease ATP-binding subunit ClpC
MFERFTDLARRSVVLAQESCRELRHPQINPEHLLLGVSQVETGIGAQVLAHFGITPTVLREFAAALSPAGNGRTDSHLPFSSESKGSLESALREALALGHNFIGTEHVVLGVLRQESSPSLAVFGRFSVTPDQLRQEILKRIQLASSSDRVTSSRPDEDPSKSKSSVLDTFGRNLTALATQGSLDPVVGREKEIERVVQILSRRSKSNPCLVGEPGVGKTAIVEGLAQQIAEGTVPSKLKDVQVYTIDLGAMVAGSRYRGDFEERMKKLIKELRDRRDVVVFLDEIHTLVGAGAAEGSIDASNMLKPALSRGEIRVIGATTFDEYRKNIEKDAALERRFQPVTIDEPTPEVTKEILINLKGVLEKHHECLISDEAIDAAVTLSVRYIPERNLPDKALDLLDEAGAFLSTHPDYTTELTQDNVRILSRSVVERVCAQWCKVPIERLSSDDASRLMEMEDELSRRVVGQDEALRVVSRSLRRARSGLGDPRRPTGSFLFLGPTGVGKTEVAKALAEFMFGTQDRLISLDMSEYQESHSVSRLVGAPPGYVGHDNAGQLTELVRRNPYSVVLFDEVEKAHPDVFNTLLQILEEGRLTDSQGRVVDFRNSVIILTSNLGSEKLSKQSIGFSSDAHAAARTDAVMREAAKKFFKPELLNRLDEIVVFSPLSPDVIDGITHKFLDALRQRLVSPGIGLEYDSSAVEVLSRLGFDNVYGARPLRRVIQRLVEDPLSEYLLTNLVRSGDTAVLTGLNDEIRISFTSPEQEVSTNPSSLWPVSGS